MTIIDDLPAPEYHKPSNQNIMKMITIEHLLNNMGFPVKTGKDVVDIIEKNGLDLSQFNFPYDSFEVFKEHALSGEWGSESWPTPPEKVAAFRKEVKDRKLWFRY